MIAAIPVRHPGRVWVNIEESLFKILDMIDKDEGNSGKKKEYNIRD